MPALRVAAVQAAYVLMDRDATIDRVAELTAAAAREGAQLVVFPEVFVPGTPIWIDTQVIWEGDEDWFGLLAANAVVIGSPATERLAAIAAQHQVWLVVGVDEREEHGATIYNTVPPPGSRRSLQPPGRLPPARGHLAPSRGRRDAGGVPGAGHRRAAGRGGAHQRMKRTVQGQRARGGTDDNHTAKERTHP
jgi:nitrilase